MRSLLQMLCQAVMKAGGIVRIWTGCRCTKDAVSRLDLHLGSRRRSCRKQTLNELTIRSERLLTSPPLPILLLLKLLPFSCALIFACGTLQPCC